MGAFFQDLRQAVRVFRQAPAFAATAVAALAIGIGANTAVFSVINAALLRPLPYPEPEQVMMLQTTTPTGGGGGASPTKFNYWRQQTDIFEGVSAYRYSPVNLTGVDVPEQIQSAQVAENFFRVFGMRIGTGRGFTPDEDLPNGPPVAVISDGLWKRRFAGDPALIGRTISLSDTPHVVVGIVAPGYTTEANPPAEVWVPLQIDPTSRDHAQYFTAVGRLKAGVTLEMANARLKVAAEGFRRMYPGALGPQNAFGVQPMRDALIGNARASLFVLVGAVVFVLLIAKRKAWIKSSVMVFSESQACLEWPLRRQRVAFHWKAGSGCRL
jgi:hypothetical protein